MRKISVLVVEDEQDKREAICAEISGYFGDEIGLDTSSTFAEATQRILGRRYDLIVIDLMLPRRSGDLAVDVSEEMIDHLANSELNRLATVVAISRFEEVVIKRQGAFTKAGIFLIGYAEADDWKACLRVCIQKAAFRTVYDFVIVCGLERERAAFEAVHHPGFVFGDLITTQGLDVRELKIGNLCGACVLAPRMGLVDASITASRALDAFTPKLICMSGICGGFAGETEQGALLVSDVTWEHQVGKWKGKNFEVRSYQEPLNNDVRIALSQMIECDPKLSNLASGKFEIQMPHLEARLCPTVSGSAVIASAEYAESIAKQHGKVAGIDMEVFGVYRAAALHGRSVICFAAKTVVDLANEEKSDDIQQAGAILSARFVVKAIDSLLSSAT